MRIFYTALIFCFTVCYGDEFSNVMRSGNKTESIIENWATNIGKNYNLNVLCKNNTGSLVDEGTEQTNWCSKFMVRGHQMTIEEMRPIAEQIYQSLWKIVNEEKIFAQHLINKNILVPWYVKDLTIDHIGIRIDLWDENNDRYIYPHLSQVIMTGNKAYYYYADPKTQALQKPGVIELLPNWVIGNNVSSASNI